jgi:hypothetical protein
VDNDDQLARFQNNTIEAVRGDTGLLFTTSKGDIILQNAKTSYIAFYCGSEALILLIPSNDFVNGSMA